MLAGLQYYPLVGNVSLLVDVFILANINTVSQIGLLLKEERIYLHLQPPPDVKG